MLRKGNTLHFINRVDETNCGDMVVCPLLHYANYFKQYSIRRHDMRFIDFESIDSSDVVIIGGGGMLNYAEFTNCAINQVLDTGATVIAWSPGFNTHTEYKGTWRTPIDFDKFVLITVRDFENNYGLPYLPDVTCKLPGLKRGYPIRRKFAIAQHKDYPIHGFGFDSIRNDQGIDEILRFIGESEIILSNSFHMIHWAMLMGKKTICIDPFSDKFFSYRYKPAYFYSATDSFENCAVNAPAYQILDECIAANDAFFSQVKKIVESRLTPIAVNSSVVDFSTREALLMEKVRETRLQRGDLIASQLFIDTGNGFTENCKQTAINNVYGDPVHTVVFDVSQFHAIRAMRFDPLEGHYCEVEILSAKDAHGAVYPEPQASIRVGKADRFLSTDPQYLIASPCENFLEIRFRLRVLSLFEAEQAVYSYIWHQSEQFAQQEDKIVRQAELIEQLNTQIGAQDALLSQQRERMEWQDGQIVRQAELIEQLNTQIGAKDAFLAQQRERMEWQDGQIVRQAELIEQLNTQVGAQDALLSQQRERMEWQDGQIVRQAELIEQLNTQVGAQDALLSQQRERMEWQDGQIVRQTELIEQLNTQVGAQDTLLSQQRERMEWQNSQIEDLHTQLEELQNSVYWKMMAPFRAVHNYFKRARKGSR
jgi:hypothetical protein